MQRPRRPENQLELARIPQRASRLFTHSRVPHIDHPALHKFGKNVESSPFDRKRRPVLPRLGPGIEKHLHNRKGTELDRVQDRRVIVAVRVIWIRVVIEQYFRAHGAPFHRFDEGRRVFVLAQNVTVRVNTALQQMLEHFVLARRVFLVQRSRNELGDLVLAAQVEKNGIEEFLVSLVNRALRLRKTLVPAVAGTTHEIR